MTVSLTLAETFPKSVRLLSVVLVSWAGTWKVQNLSWFIRFQRLKWAVRKWHLFSLYWSLSFDWRKLVESRMFHITNQRKCLQGWCSWDRNCFLWTKPLFEQSFGRKFLTGFVRYHRSLDGCRMWMPRWYWGVCMGDPSRISSSGLHIGLFARYLSTCH